MTFESATATIGPTRRDGGNKKARVKDLREREREREREKERERERESFPETNKFEVCFLFLGKGLGLTAEACSVEGNLGQRFFLKL